MTMTMIIFSEMTMMITYIGTDAGRKNKITTTKQNTVFVIYLRVVYNLFYQILSDYQGTLVGGIYIFSSFISELQS